MLGLFLMVSAAVAPMPVSSTSLQTIIGFLITLLLGIISFFATKLYNNISKLFVLVETLSKDFYELKGQHDAYTRHAEIEALANKNPDHIHM